MGICASNCNSCRNEKCCQTKTFNENEERNHVEQLAPGFSDHALILGEETKFPTAAAGADKSFPGSSTHNAAKSDLDEQTVPYKDGSVYTGTLVDGRREGHGVWRATTGSYEGQWVSDQQSGEGRQTWTDGRIYEGQFRYGKFDGSGRMVWHTQQGMLIYEGQYENDAKHGVGKFLWPDGRVYDGDWKHGKRWGRGVYINSRGERKEGAWVDDKFERWITEDSHEFQVGNGSEQPMS